MAGLELNDFVLLGSNFWVLAEPSEGSGDVAAENGEPDVDVSEPDDASTLDWKRLELDDAELLYSASREEDEFVLLAQLTVKEPAAPYHVEVVTGSRFDVPDDPAVSIEEAEATLIFIAYPYIREVVMNLTARSPYREFVLRPLTRLPHPRVSGDTSESHEDDAD